MKKINLFKNMTAAIAALFIAMFAMPQKAMAEKYDLWIAGVQVTSDNCKDLSVINGVSGKVKYDNATKLLTLDNATINTGETVIEVDKGGTGVEDYTILVKGNNVLNSTNGHGLRFAGVNLNIKGSGSLAVNCDRFIALCIYKGNTTVSGGCSLTMKGCQGVNGWKEAGLTIDGSHFTAISTGTKDYDNAMRELTRLTLYNCQITQPAGAAYDSSLKGVALNGKLVKGKVVIEPKQVEAYGLRIAGVQVTSENCDDLSVIPGVSGTVKYDHSKETLYLNGVKIETTADVNGIDSKIDGLTIKAYGNNTIKVGGFSAIRNTESHCNITGGKLYLSGEDFGLYVMYKASMTIENSTIESDGSVGTNNNNAKMTIRNSKLTAKKKSYYASMMGIKELTLEGCTITQPTGAKYDASLKGVALNGKLVESKVVIEPKLPEGAILYEGFEQGVLPAGWTVIDNDGDGHNWIPASSLFNSVEFVEARSGNDMFSSQSYDNPTQKPLTPDNYLITPEVSGATSVKFYVSAQDKNYPAEHLAVCASKTGKAASNFTIVEEWTMTGENASWTVYNINLPAGTKYVAFRHYNCTDNFVINIDDVTIFGNTTGIDAPTADVPARKQGVYNLQGVRLGTSLDRLPKGIYVVDGRKVVKR